LELGKRRVFSIDACTHNSIEIRAGAVMTDKRGNTYRVARVTSESVQVGGGGKLWDRHGMQKRALSYRTVENFVYYQKMSANYPQLGYSDENKSSVDAFVFELERAPTVDKPSKPRMPALNKRAGRM